MKIRLAGTQAECAAVVDALRERWQVLDVSRPYPDIPGAGAAAIVRVYVTVLLPLSLPGGEP